MNLFGQLELYPSINEKDIERTKFLLSKYCRMIKIMKDYENHREDLEATTIEGETARRIEGSDLHADKTANSVILTEKQKWVYGKYKEITAHIRRAHGLIDDHEEKQVIAYRYLEGHPYTKTVVHFESNFEMLEETTKRRLRGGIESIADSLKLWGALEDWKF